MSRLPSSLHSSWSPWRPWRTSDFRRPNFPVVTVIGKAFYDIDHSVKTQKEIAGTRDLALFAPYVLGFADLLATCLRCRFVRVQAGLQPFQEEAVCHTAPVNILSRDRS